MNNYRQAHRASGTEKPQKSSEASNTEAYRHQNA